MIVDDWGDWRVRKLITPENCKRTYLMHVPSGLTAWADGWHDSAKYLRDIIEKELEAGEGRGE